MYAKECKEWVGYLVDHNPWPEYEKQDMKEAIDKTDDMWKNEFGYGITEEHITRVRSQRSSSLEYSSFL